MKNSCTKRELTNKNRNESKDYLVNSSCFLFDFLQKTLKDKSRNNIKMLLTKKYILVNGSVISQYNYELVKKDIVSICKNPVNSNETSRYKKGSNLKIIYEDDNIIVIDKPAGLLSVASDKEKVETSYKQVLDYLKSKDKRSRVYVTHRLDKETSGVLLFSKSDTLKEELQDNWNQVVTKRGYYALIEGKLAKKDDTIINYLLETSTNVMYASSDKKNGKKAITHYHVMKENNKYSLVDVNIDSGRKNQIRVAFSSLNHPVVGDDKYGNGKSVIKRLGLHAYELEISIRGKKYNFKSEMPMVFKSVFGGK